VSREPEVVVITGASAGVGRAAARKFARHGARIGLLARGVDGLKAAQREVQKLGSEALIIPTDVANAEQVEAAAEKVETELGPIDIWVNNAMTSVFSPIKQMTSEEFRRVTEVTYLGYVYGTLAAFETNVAAQSGRNRAGGQRPRLSGHSVAGCLLRSQARYPGLLRFAPLRVTP